MHPVNIPGHEEKVIMLNSEVKYQPEKGGCYLGSPSLLRLPDGALLATHDYFGAGSPRHWEWAAGLTSVYRSEDNGLTWNNIVHLTGSYWSSLFLHDDAVWLLGSSREYGDIVIRRSGDSGFSWTSPEEPERGLLFRGGARKRNPNYHCAPVPVLFHEDRIYRAFEDYHENLPWPAGFDSCMISADAGSNLLDASSWKMSNKLRFDPGWMGNRLFGWLEGNAVAGPDGRLFNLLRLQHAMDDNNPNVPFDVAGYHTTCAGFNKAAMIGVSPGGEVQSFDPETGIINFPGGGFSKFTIRRDPLTGYYFSLVNATPESDVLCWRNVLSLAVSENLRNWRIAGKFIEDDSGLDPESSRHLSGFQYADWQFDGDDLICLVRTAHRGAHNFHDSNRITFHVLKNFRETAGITECKTTNTGKEIS